MKYRYRSIIFFLLLIWFLGIFFQYFINLDDRLLFLYPFINKSYSLVCHQHENKLISFSGIHSLVCARCTGIYAGLLAASFISLFVNFKRPVRLKLFILLSLPMLTDVISYSFGIYNYSRTIAFMTGILFGSAGFSYFYGSIKELLAEIHLRK